MHSRIWTVRLAVFLLTGAPAYALDGIVIDTTTGKPVANAEVSILGRPGAVRTNADGRFTWQPDPAPPFEVLVVLPGERYTKPLLIESLPANGELRIEVSPVFTEEVAVTGGAAPDIATTAVNATTLLTRADMENRQPANLMQALETVAGVSQVSEGHASVPAVRGMARGRTLILIDGARVTSERRVGPSATYLDPFVLESVEVSRGPGSVAYGPDAFGGVIYVRTRRAEPGSPFRMRFNGALGVGIPDRRVGLELSKGSKSGGVIFQAHTRDIDDYDSPRGEVFNSGANDTGFVVRGDQAIGPGTFSVGWQSDFGRDIERPRNDSRTVRFFYPTEDSHRFTAGYAAHDVGTFRRLTIDAFLGSHAQVTDQFRFATPTAGSSLERADVSANDFQVRAVAERLAGPARVEFGLDVNGRFGLRALDIIRAHSASGDLTRDTTNVSVDDAQRTDTGLFVATELPVAARVTASAGVRADRITTASRGGFFGDNATSYTAGSGHAAVTVGPFAGVSLTGQVSRGFRDPVLSDRYFRGPSGRGFITGNPDLTPETSLQFDLAARFTSRRVRLGVFFYQYNIEDLVERYQTETDFFFFRNRGEGRTRGFEVESQIDFGGGLTGDVTTQIARATLLDDGTFLDDAAADTVSFQLRKVLGPGFAQMRIARFADDDRPGPTEVAHPGYTIVDLTGGVPLSARVDLRALVRNLFNEEYLVSPDVRAALAPGRSLSVTAVVRF